MPDNNYVIKHGIQYFQGFRESYPTWTFHQGEAYRMDREEALELVKHRIDDYAHVVRLVKK
jgi:hypothetical protein